MSNEREDKNVETIKVLLIEDDPDITQTILTYLNNKESTTSETNKDINIEKYECNFDIIHKRTLTSAVNCILEGDQDLFDVVLVALGLPNGQGLDVFKKISNCCQKCPIIIISQHLDEAQEAVKLGAQDYIYKPDLTREVLIKAIRYSILRKDILLKKIKESGLELSIYEIFMEILNKAWVSDFDVLTKLIKEKIIEYTESEDAYIGIINEEKTKIVGTGQYEFYEKICHNIDGNLCDGCELSIDSFGDTSSFWGMAYNAGKSIVINNMSEYINNFENCVITVKNIIFVPLFLNDKIIGQISVVNKRKGKFTEFDVNLIRRLGNMYAVCIQKLRYEVSIHKEKEEFRKLVETTQAIIYSSDFRNNFKFTFVNDVMSKKTGYSKEELLNMSAIDLLTPTGYKIFSERITKIMNKEEVPAVLEYEVRDKEGNPGWVLITAEFIYENSNVVGANVIGIDVTERKLIQQDLLNSQARLTLALEATTDGIWEYNIKTGATFFSPRYQTMLGYEPGELGDTVNIWIDHLHPDEKEEITNELDKMYKGLTCKYINGNVYTNQFRMRCKNGEYKWIQSRGKIVERDGNNLPIRLIGSHLDITAEKELECALKKEENDRNKLFEKKISEVIDDFSSYGKYHNSRVNQLNNIIQSLEKVNFPVGEATHDGS